MTKKTAIVTGSSGGVGQATVHAFQAAGWEVIGLDRVEPPAHAPDRYVQVDFAESDQIHGALEALALTHVSALVNNAAISLDKGLLEISLDEWDHIMAVNVRAAFVMIQGLLGPLGAAGGAVVNVASVHALATSEHVAAYAASKGALVALTRAAALELAGRSIRVNAVLPGAVDTPMLRAGVGRRHPPDQIDAGLAKLAARTPLGTIGRPEEIAQSILFLADGDRSSFITGQVLVADGGATARLSTE
jgi:NAD(P)-dependent dehydrogenase (short-subunit alcohol dehydrogenase family)